MELDEIFGFHLTPFSFKILVKERGWELTINSWFSNSKIRTIIFDRFENHSPDFKLFIKLVANRLID